MFANISRHAAEGVIVTTMQNVILIGMPGTGKSTVGVLLAKRLGYRFIDTDLLIIERAGKTLPQILAEAGVKRFLTLEAEVGETLRCDKTVIATGGSMVFGQTAMKRLKEGGITVWLDTPLPILEKRILAAADRGIAAEPGMSIAQIDSIRRPLYAQYADVCIPCEGDVESIVHSIVRAMAQFTQSHKPSSAD